MASVLNQALEDVHRPTEADDARGFLRAGVYLVAALDLLGYRDPIDAARRLLRQEGLLE
ncbi:MAG: hypothetical protein ACH37Z_12295 [Anaerolineae bacterium]